MIIPIKKKANPPEEWYEAHTYVADWHVAQVTGALRLSHAEVELYKRLLASQLMQRCERVICVADTYRDCPLVFNSLTQKGAVRWCTEGPFALMLPLFMPPPDGVWHYCYRLDIPAIEICGKAAFYIGVHSTSDLDDGYCGSGSLLKHFRNRVDIFMSISEFFDSRQAAESYERAEILDGSNQIECLNITHNSNSSANVVLLRQ